MSFHKADVNKDNGGSGRIQIFWSRRLKGGLVATLCKGQKGLFITLTKRNDDRGRTRIAIIPIDIELLLILHKETHTIASTFGVKLE